MAFEFISDDLERFIGLKKEHFIKYEEINRQFKQLVVSAETSFGVYRENVENKDKRITRKFDEESLKSTLNTNVSEDVRFVLLWCLALSNKSFVLSENNKEVFFNFDENKPIKVEGLFPILQFSDIQGEVSKDIILSLPYMGSYLFNQEHVAKPYGFCKPKDENKVFLFYRQDLTPLKEMIGDLYDGGVDSPILPAVITFINSLYKSKDWFCCNKADINNLLYDRTENKILISDYSFSSIEAQNTNLMNESRNRVIDRNYGDSTHSVVFDNKNFGNNNGLRDTLSFCISLLKELSSKFLQDGSDRIEKVNIDQELSKDEKNKMKNDIQNEIFGDNLIVNEICNHLVNILSQFYRNRLIFLLLSPEDNIDEDDKEIKKYVDFISEVSYRGEDDLSEEEMTKLSNSILGISLESIIEISAVKVYILTFVSDNSLDDKYLDYSFRGNITSPSYLFTLNNKENWEENYTVNEEKINKFNEILDNQLILLATPIQEEEEEEKEG